MIAVVQRLGCRILGLTTCPFGLAARRRLSLQAGLVLHLNYFSVHTSRSIRLARCLAAQFNFRVPPSRLVLGIVPLKLSSPQQRMDLTMSEDLDLFVGQSAFHAIRIIAQVISFIIRAVLGRFCRWCDQWVVRAWEVCCLEGLEILLSNELVLAMDEKGRAHQSDCWNLHCSKLELVRGATRRRDCPYVICTQSQLTMLRVKASHNVEI